jgi:DsbC/DsbD-like thiol-disulfide interchange protein
MAAEKLAFPSAMIPRSTAALLAAIALPPASHAASSDWFEVEGGKVRIVSSGLPDAQGRLRGAIEIELHPGWKTYWRDPGEAGIPPHLEVGRSLNVSDAEIGFPLPQHFEDGYSTWAGYSHSVVLPVTLQVPTPDAAVIVTADLQLGICESICIPVSASLEFDPAAGADDMEHNAIVDAAFAALPEASHKGFEVVAARTDDTGLTIEADVPGATPELFLETPENWRIGAPKLVERRGSRAVFHAKVLDRPAGAAAFDYTLGDGEAAVDGRFTLP